MKNIHLLPTIPNFRGGGVWIKETRDWCNIYITSDEEIKEGDWYLTNKNTLCKCIKTDSKYVYSLNGGSSTNCKKIILTTDQDLIKDGVQAIDDEFLEWFVNNPSCESVETERFYSMSQSSYSGIEYEIILPKEEQKQENDYTALLKPVGTKQETLEEETVEEYFLSNIKNMLQFNNDALAIRFMEKYYHAKKEQERSYSEEEVYNIVEQAIKDNSSKQLHFFDGGYSNPIYTNLKKWFEQFKKK
jgi:hypothetical protein